MPMYKLVEYSDDHSETSGSLWQYYRNEPGLMMLLIIFLVIVLRLNLNKKQLVRTVPTAQKERKNNGAIEIFK